MATENPFENCAQTIKDAAETVKPRHWYSGDTANKHGAAKVLSNLSDTVTTTGEKYADSQDVLSLKIALDTCRKNFRAEQERWTSGYFKGAFTAASQALDTLEETLDIKNNPRIQKLLPPKAG